MDKRQKIEVSSKILGHISTGIYRSPAGAIKELISNAFDADATQVVVTTNWPSFDIITCRDNGSGMTQEKFVSIMKGEIGDSTKRAPSASGNVEDTTAQGRPIIGRLGIGLMGIAQICHAFNIISHHKKTRTAFSASIYLEDFLDEKMRDKALDDASQQQIHVGQFEVETIAYEPDRAGTYVIASDMRSAFIRKFRETLGEVPLPLPTRYSVFLKEIHDARSVKSLSDYWQMVWELSVACPVPYVDSNPFEWNSIKADDELKNQLANLQKKLEAFQFEVIVDGLSLRKPNQYPLAAPRSAELEPITGRLFSVNNEEEVYGRMLKLSGYIYLQYSRAVEPMELRGLLIRIRNIAIGNYDSTLFNYPRIPAPRFNWLSGEIHVEEGLESAINIDRDSFNEVHPHFVKLKEAIHNMLEKQIFPESERSQAERRKRKRESRENEKQTTIKSLISQELGGTYEVRSTNKERYPLTIDSVRDRILENSQSIFLPSGTNKRELIKYIAYAYELAMETPEANRRERFYQLLSEFVNLGLL